MMRAAILVALVALTGCGAELADAVAPAPAAVEAVQCGYPVVGWDEAEQWIGYDEATGDTFVTVETPYWHPFDGPTAWAGDDTCTEYGEAVDVLTERWAQGWEGSR